jgi:hypothetical protein
MHPPRRKRITEESGLVDRLVDRLLGRCPFSTLTVLTLVVVSPSVGPIPEPLYLAVPVVMADLVVNLLSSRARSG